MQQVRKMSFYARVAYYIKKILIILKNVFNFKKYICMSIFHYNEIYAHKIVNKYVNYSFFKTSHMSGDF